MALVDESIGVHAHEISIEVECVSARHGNPMINAVLRLIKFPQMLSLIHI